MVMGHLNQEKREASERIPSVLWTSVKDIGGSRSQCRRHTRYLGRGSSVAMGFRQNEERVEGIKPFRGREVERSD